MKIGGITYKSQQQQQLNRKNILDKLSIALTCITRNLYFRKVISSRQ